MGRPRCDPFDAAAIITALDKLETTPLKAYQDYASVAARPYGRSTFELLLKRARRGSPHRGYADEIAPQTQRSLADQDAASDAYWAEFLSVKPRVLTTVADNASLRVKGKSLIVHDGDRRIVYDAGALKPRAIIMAGYGGVVSVEAIRFACDHKIAIGLLDWLRDFLTIVGAPAKPSAALLRAQVQADQLAIARAIVAAKTLAHIHVGATDREVAARFVQSLAAAQSVREIMIIEAQAARSAWPDVPPLHWRAGGPRVPSLWKLPYSTRKRFAGPSARRAVHPINALLNVAFAVHAGRLSGMIAVRGAHPAIGFLHADKPGRWSLAYDAIEPLRPLIEMRVFDYIRKHQFSGNDFILAQGQIRLMDNLLRVVIAETALSHRVLDAAVDWLIGLIQAAPLTGFPGAEPPLFLSNFPLFKPRFEEGLRLREGVV
jgi:CRISPR-associated protein Cas1